MLQKTTPSIEELLIDAITNGSIAQVKSLVKQSVNLNVSFNPLYLALDKKQEQIASFLIDNGANIHDHCIDQNSSTPLHLAASLGLTQIIQKLIRKGVDINALDAKGDTPLHCCAKSGQILEAKVLIEANANINAKNTNGLTPLHYALGAGNEEMALFMIEQGANINQLTDERFNLTPLHMATTLGFCTVAHKLLEKGAKLNVQDAMGCTPLHLAAALNHIEVIKSLIQRGADIEAKEYRFGCTPLYMSLGGKHEEIALFMIDQGANINQLTGEPFNSTPLHMVAALGFYTIAHKLLEKGAKINAQDAMGYTPLHLAAALNHLEVTKSLIQAGADVDAKARHDITPLHCALEYGHEEIALLLITHGADVNQQTAEKFGTTPLHIASSLGLSKTVLVLLQKEAKIDTKDFYQGSTPLHWCAKMGHAEVTKILIEAGANVKARDNNGATPLHSILEQANQEIELFFIKQEGENLPQIIIDGRPMDLSNFYEITSISTKVKLKAGSIIDNFKKCPIALDKVQITQMLIKAGADVNAKSNNDIIPLYSALNFECQEIALLLIDNGADINAIAVGKIKARPLHWAALRGLNLIVQKLLEKGANIEAPTLCAEFTPLHFAAQEGQIETLILLLKAGANINAVDNLGNTPLYPALYRKKEEAALFLIDSGACINERIINNAKTTPLHIASSIGLTNVIQKLIQKGVTLDSRDSEENHPLHCAIKYGALQPVQVLIEAGADVNAINKEYFNPLGYSIYLKHEEIALFLINASNDVSSISFNMDGLTLLHFAVRAHLKAVTERLLEKGININSQENYFGITPLHLALMNTQDELAIFLIEQGANIHNQMDEPLETAPLHIAARFGFNNVIQKLIQCGANINIKDAAGCSALHFAALSNHVETSKYLIQAGANVNAKALHNIMPLHCALEYGHEDLAILLIDSGADINAQTSEMFGVAPLHIAASLGLDKVMQKLIQHGANLNARDLYQNFTPLHWAINTSNINATKILIEAGANVNARDISGLTPLDFTTELGHKVDKANNSYFVIFDPESYIPKKKITLFFIDEKKRDEQMSKRIKLNKNGFAQSAIFYELVETNIASIFKPCTSSYETIFEPYTNSDKPIQQDNLPQIAQILTNIGAYKKWEEDDNSVSFTIAKPQDDDNKDLVH